MSKLKKVLLMGAAYVLVATLAIGGTIAYLTSNDSNTNVMKLGNVEIDQIEQQRVDDKDNQTVLEDFENDKPLYPAVFEGSSIAWAPENEWVVAGDEAWKVVEDNANVVDKFVTVKNTGKSAAYVRTLIAYEGDEEYGPNGPWIHVVTNGTNVAPQIPNNFIGYINIDGVDYTVYEYVYPEALAPGETTIPSLKQVYMNKNADNDVVAYYGETYNIIVVSQAVQSDGFNDAKTALDTAFGEITPDNHPFPTTIYITTNDEAKLLNALRTDAKVIILTDIVDVTKSEFDGKGEEVTLAGTGEGCYGYLAFNPGKGNDTTVENLTITGSGFVEVGHYKEGGGNYAVNNLVIKDLNATLAIVNVKDKIAAAFSHYGKALLKNCVMTGTTTSVEGWENFAYDASFVNGTKTTIEGGTYGSIYVNSQAHVTIKNAKVGKIDTSAITLKNLGMVTICAGTTVDTITITPATGNYKPALTIEAGATVDVIDLSVITNASKVDITIEDGATVSAFIDNGVEYATLDAWRAAQ